MKIIEFFEKIFGDLTIDCVGDYATEEITLK